MKNKNNNEQFNKVFYDSRNVTTGNVRTGYTNNTGNTYSGKEATIVNFPVTLNDVNINNEHAKYPFLLYNSVTYLPLTWKYTVDEFGFSNSFSQEKGLNIDSK